MKRSTEERSCPAEMDNNFQTHYKRLEKTRPPIDAVRRFRTPAYEAVTTYLKEERRQGIDIRTGIVE